jgi:hypothetical protein
VPQCWLRLTHDVNGMPGPFRKRYR